MAGRGQQVTYRKTPQSLSAVARMVDKTDFPLRMRNRMAADLRPKEVVIDDDYAAISRGEQLGKRAARKSLPRFGLVMATTERLRIATAEDEHIVDVRLEDVRLTHDEDSVLTMTIRPTGRPAEPMTLVFAKRRSSVAKFLRDKYSDHEPGGPSKAGLRKLLPGS
jgi:hypothetical protein